MPDPAWSRWIERRARIGFHNEHAETGKPDASSDEDESRGDLASNGPARVDHLFGMGMVLHPSDEEVLPGAPIDQWRSRVAGDDRSGGHKHSAFG
jgi:hypothetical protein